METPLIVLLSAVVAQSVHGAPSPYQQPHAPATKSAYLTLPPGAVEPQGWLRDWCEQVRDGFTARMEDVDPAFKQAWAADYRITGPNLDWNKGGWPYEGGGYWFEGLAGMAVQLKDERLISLANRRFDAVVTNMNERSILFYWWLDRTNAEDGKAAEGRYNMSEPEWPMWAAGLLGRALVRQYAATGDARVLEALETAYAGNREWVKLGWAGSNPWPAFATHGWTGNPKIAEALTAFYNELGDEKKNSALQLHSNWSRYRRMPAPADGNDHGVHFLESTTAWALGYLWTGKREFLEACLAWHRQVERDCMQPHGVPVFDELYGPTGAGRKTETCDVAGFIWSKNMLLWISGDGALADQTERAFFNAAPGVFGRNGQTHLYLQPANYLHGSGQSIYGRSHYPLCCSAALNRILPEYVGGMWLASQDGGLVAACYGPSVLNAVVADRVKVRIASETCYPFTETITMKVEPERPVEFPLSLRVPGWCAAPEIRVNGTAITLSPAQGFHRIQRKWQGGDQVTIHLPMRAAVATGLDRNAKPPAPFTSVSYGPLLFVLPIAETKDGKGADPAVPWKFAVAGTTIKVERDTMPARWEWPLAAPLRLKVPAQAFDWPGNDPGALPGLVDDASATEVTLVPYGCAKYRVALFPVTAKAWRAAGGIELPKRLSRRLTYLSFNEGTNYTITGYVTNVAGVQGSALKFDGFTSRVTPGTNVFISITNGFSVQCWIAPQEYSWNWTGLVDQEKDHKEGFSFGINHVGHVGLCLAINGEWQSFLSKEPVPLLRWSHVAATVDPAKGVALYINGQPAGAFPVTGNVTPSQAECWIGMSHTKQWPALTEREVSKIPTPMVFDGVIDEVKLEAKALDPAAVMAAFKAVVPENPQPLQYRRMPSGPEGPGPFGAYYTRLKYCEEWDRLWRVSDHPDIVVRFDETPARIVFWRGTGYMPAWVSENDRWVSDQGPEIYKGQCYEHMSDKQCRFSHVRIIEDSPARILVHWRTALPNVKYQSTHVDPETGWEPWGDDYYTIYPDNVCVRYQRAWGPSIHEFQQTEVLCQPGTKPQDVMEAEAVTVMDLNGNTNTFSWETAYGKRLPAEKNVDGPIQIVNLKSKNRHFVIGESGAHFKPFIFGALKGYSNFPNWNHWPVAQLPNDGRVAPAPDRPSSSCPGTLFPVRHKGEGVQEYVRNLYGMTDRDPRHLATLARSWNNPPVLELLGEAFANEGYDKNQRAYVLSHKGQGKPAELNFSIKASEESPIVNVPMVIKNWGGYEARLILDGKPVAQSKSFRVGHRRRLEGTDLIVWIQVESRTPLKLRLSAE